MKLDSIRWIDLPCKPDVRGMLTIVGHDELPFPIARLFYVYKVPDGLERGGHAHRVTEQFVIPVAGSFILDLTDGSETRTFMMDNPGRGIYIPPLIWDRVYSFSPDAVCLVLASTPYSESDYIRNWPDYLEALVA